MQACYTLAQLHATLTPMMQVLGAVVVPSPSRYTLFGSGFMVHYTEGDKILVVVPLEWVGVQKDIVS